MLTDLNTSVTDISPEQLDALFQTTPDTTPTADSLVIGKDKDGFATVPHQDDHIPTLDLDNLEVSEEEEVEGDEDKDKPEVEVPADKDKDKPATTDKPEEGKEGDDAPVDTTVLKSTVDYLIEKGIFKDFEGREDLEMTEELYAEILEQQIEAIADERYSSRKTSAGEYGQAILDYLEDGGDPDQIIDLFKERKEVAQFDIASEESQKEIIARYYKEVYGWKGPRIEREIETLSLEEDGLKGEAEDIKTRYEEHYKKQTEALKVQQAEERKAYEAEQVRRQQTFETSIKEAIKGYDVDETRKKAIEDSLFKQRKLKDGTKVNDFYIKFAEWQSDPKKYVELVEFITNYDSYQKRKENEIQNKVTDKTFRFVKGNQAVSKKKGSEHVTPEEKAQNTGTNFSLIFKK